MILFNMVVHDLMCDKDLKCRLATLLEGAGYLFFKISSVNSKSINFWWNIAVKLDCRINAPGEQVGVCFATKNYTCTIPKGV